MASEFDALADAHVYGLHTPEEAQAFARRLRSEPALAAALALAQRRRAVVEMALPPAEASEALVRATLARIDRNVDRARRRQRQLLTWFLAPLAAALLVLGLCHYHYATLSASPITLDVLGQDEWLPGSTTALHVRLTNRHSHQPMAGVPVQVELRPPGGEFSALAEVQTDAYGHGAPAFRLPDWPDGTYELRVRAGTSGQPEQLTRSVRLKRAVRLMVSTDKPRYQPGQALHIRALAQHKLDSKPVVATAAYFSVRDPAGRIVLQSSQELNRFGLAAATALLDSDAPLGRYQVACTVGDTTSTSIVAVERYSLPKAKILLTPDKRWYRPGEEAAVALTGTYFDGQPAAGVAAQLDVSLAPNTIVAATRTTTLDALGRALVRFQVPSALPPGQANGHVMVGARLGMAPAALAATTMYIPVAEQPVLVHTTLSNDGAGATRLTAIALRTPDGNVVTGTGQIRSGGQSYPFQTDTNGNAALDIAMPANTRSIGVALSTASGETLDLTVAIASAVQQPTVLLSTDRRTYRVSETMKIRCQGPDGPISLDFRRGGQTMRTAMLEVRAGQGELELDLAPDMQGTWTVLAYQVAGRFEFLTAVEVQVEPIQGIDVRTTLDQPEYRPGATAKLRMAVTDSSGTPIVAALSVALVNEAVFHAWHQHEDGNSIARGGVFSLQAESYAQKHADVARTKENRLELVQAGWLGLGLLLVLAFYAVLWVKMRRRYLLLAHVVVGVFVFCAGGIYVLVSWLGAENTSTFAGVANDMQRVSEAPAAAKSASPGVAAPPRIVPPDEPHFGAETVVETLLWRPILLTDANGQAALEVPVGETVATWRCAVQAITENGQLGNVESALSVYAPFSVAFATPVALVHGDELTVLVTVASHANSAQNIQLQVRSNAAIQSAPVLQPLQVPARGTIRLPLRVRAVQPGPFELAVHAETAAYQMTTQRTGTVRSIPAPPAPSAVPRVQTTFSARRCAVGDRIVVRHTSMPPAAPSLVEFEMECPIPAGFAVERNDLDDLVRRQGVLRYRLAPDRIVVVLAATRKPVSVTYALEAVLAGEVTALAAVLRPGDSNDTDSMAAPLRLTILPRSK